MNAHRQDCHKTDICLRESALSSIPSSVYVIWMKHTRRNLRDTSIVQIKFLINRRLEDFFLMKSGSIGFSRRRPESARQGLHGKEIFWKWRIVSREIEAHHSVTRGRLLGSQGCGSPGHHNVSNLAAWRTKRRARPAFTPSLTRF